jgi:hypothetical protein
MVRRALLFLGALSLVACAAPPPDENAASSADIVVGAKATPKPKNKVKTEADRPLQPIYVDPTTGDQVAPPAGLGPTGALSLDGNPCTIDKLNLDTAVQGNGWTLTIDAHCGSATVSFQASGTTDGGYPQTGAKAFGSTAAALLTVSSTDGSDPQTFDSESGGDSNVDAGPTNADKVPVEGYATVANNDTFASHDVSYAVQF